MKKFSAILFTVSLIFGLIGQANATLITNGSFETGPAVGAFLPLAPGSTAIDGWTVTPVRAIDYVGSLWTAQDGSRSIDLNGSFPGGIMTSFATVLGQDYLVEFYMAGNVGGGPVIKELQVQVDSETWDFSFDSSGQSFADMGWEKKSFVFTAADTTSYLTFTSLIAGSYGPALDNVSVTASAVPEPTTLLLLGTGLIGLAGFRRKFRK